MEYVNKSVLLIRGYDVHDCVANPQSCESVCSNDSPKPGNLQRVWYPLCTTNFQNIVVGVLCLLEIKLAKLTHYTVITIQVFVIAHVFVQCTASVALSL